jgi:hypothetical protein
MKRSLFLLLTLLSVFMAKGQSDDNVTLDFYGFVRVDGYMDTYKGVDAGHDIFYLLPLYTKPGGVEVNNQLSSNISAMASRLGVKITFPEILKAKATGLIEMDFAGNLKADPTLLRIRQAYSLLTWEKSSLLVGQTWHPFFGGSCLPTVAGLNTGAPFTCFNRSPMIRYNMKFSGLTVSASAVGQMQYNSPAVDATDADLKIATANQAKRNGVVPELVLSTEWTKKSITLGAGASYNRIKPRLRISGTLIKSVADEYLSSTAFMAYGRYKKDKLTVLLKGYLGDNMSHLVLPGGYGVAKYDSLTGAETYTCYKTYTSSLSIVYGQKWQLGLFIGYGGNLGTNDKLYDATKTYGPASFNNMQTMYRIAPHISLNLPKFRLVAEYERTTANYGTGTFNLDNGLYATSTPVTNNRVIIVMTQYF